MKNRKIPLRKCVVTNERIEKRDLLRVVRTPEGNVIYDPTGKANGRGVYLSKKRNVIEKAQKHQILSRHLKVNVPENIFKQLMQELDHA
ncbi:MAG TPA: YlxR family protein [Candidatus Izemoplasmatales bacterium]|nr:YlxR family protein [Candidatus Izemoplasmatales bacterium]